MNNGLNVCALGASKTLTFKQAVMCIFKKYFSIASFSTRSQFFGFDTFTHLMFDVFRLTNFGLLTGFTLLVLA